MLLHGRMPAAAVHLPGDAADPYAAVATLRAAANGLYLPADFREVLRERNVSTTKPFEASTARWLN
jgi:hypothetical protein